VSGRAAARASAAARHRRRHLRRRGGLRERATACAREALAFLDAHPGEALDHDVIYQLALANQLAVNLLREAERRRRPASPRAFVSAAGNLAQESAMLATARRRHDPSLAAADAPAAAAPPRRR